jgi:ABC-type transport system involved in multi-copper enzyme maturation permease subunit
MSQTPDFAAPPDPGSSWPLWSRQVIAIVRLEWFRTLIGRRSLPVWLFAGLPVLFFLLRMVAPIQDREDIASAVLAFAKIHNLLIVRLVTFVSCLLVCTNLFRGEMVHQTLHYYFLVPVRRSVLVVGKFVGGLVATAIILCGSTVASYLLLLLAHGSADAGAHLTTGPGIGQLLGFVAATALAALGYGTVFLLIGLLFKNPIVFAVFVWLWEWANFILPATLKKISIVHYVQSMSPVPIDQGPLAVVISTTSPWVAVPGLLLVSALFLAISSWILGRSEIRYGTD